MLLNEWLAQQDDAFKKEVGINLKSYMCTSCTLKELEELDNRFINYPEGDNSERRKPDAV